GGVPALAGPAEKAIAIQLACGAASRSSGEVRASGASVRDPQLTGRSWNVPLDPELTPPLPLARSPCQVTVAVRTAAIDAPPALYPARPSLPLFETDDDREAGRSPSQPHRPRREGLPASK